MVGTEPTDVSPSAAAGCRPRIMLMEGNRGLRQSIRHVLEEQNYEIESASDAFVAVERLAQVRPNVVIVDLMLPRGDGLEFIRRLRRRPGGQNVAVILLSSKDSVEERLEGFVAGADDYVIKPFSMAELAARIKARRRHVWSPAPEVLTFADAQLDTVRRVVERGSRTAELTTTEYHLLELFMRHPD